MTEQVSLLDNLDLALMGMGVVILSVAATRWLRLGRIAHRAEPDLKSGRGGLRDVQMLNALARVAKQESLEIQVLFESDRPLREVDEGGEFNGLKVFYAPDTEQLVAKAKQFYLNNSDKINR